MRRSPDGDRSVGDREIGHTIHRRPSEGSDDQKGQCMQGVMYIDECTGPVVAGSRVVRHEADAVRLCRDGDPTHGVVVHVNMNGGHDALCLVEWAEQHKET